MSAFYWLDYCVFESYMCFVLSPIRVEGPSQLNTLTVCGERLNHEAPSYAILFNSPPPGPFSFSSQKMFLNILFLTTLSL
jgi:hypothetical protein